MKYKPVPQAPDSLDYAAEVQRAVPLVPGTTEDCCGRVMSRAGVPSQDEARRWLTFLQALGLVRETDRGFARNRVEVDEAELAEAFEVHVFGASEVLGTLASADEPLDAESVFADFEDNVPNWERYHKPTDWQDIWSDRVGRMLEWGVLFELVERVDDGYRVAEE